MSDVREREFEKNSIRGKKTDPTSESSSSQMTLANPTPRGSKKAKRYENEGMFKGR